jgi:hypothetical protein
MDHSGPYPSNMNESYEHTGRETAFRTETTSVTLGIFTVHKFHFALERVYMGEKV